MQMSPADIRNYPRFAYYVRHDLPEVIRVPRIVRAMNNIGQLNRARFQRALRWEFIPTIKITNLADAYGEFTPNIGSNEIRIDTRVVTEFEDGRGRRLAAAGNVFLVGVTILHELVHWGDDQDGIDRPGEEGNEFERLVYGAVVD